MALHTADSPRAIRPAVERHAARNRQSPRVAARNISGSVDGTRSDSGCGGTTRVYCQSRVQGSASSNCLELGALDGPALLGPGDGVERRDELAHDGDQRDFAWFPGGDQPFIEGAQQEVVAGGG